MIIMSQDESFINFLIKRIKSIKVSNFDFFLRFTASFEFKLSKITVIISFFSKLTFSIDLPHRAYQQTEKIIGLKDTNTRSY